MRAALLVIVLLVGLSSVAAASQPQPPKDFVPVDDAAAGEQLPAMPLIGTAYGFIWVGVLGYVWSLGRRLHKVEQELSELESRKK